MKTRSYAKCLSLLIAVACFGMPAAADDHWSYNWTIEVGGKAASRGNISFMVTFEPNDEGVARDSVSVDVPVADKSKDDEVAEFIENAFKAALGEDDFNIDGKWGAGVKIKTRGKTPDYALALTNNTVQGVMLILKD